MGFEEAHNTWSRNRYEHYSVEFLEKIVQVCLPLTKNKNLPKKAPMEHQLLPDFPTLGTLTGHVDEYYPEQAKNDNQLIFKASGERENEELMGK